MSRFFSAVLCLYPVLALADPPDIVAVTAHAQGDRWRFDVTLAHPDTGWDHYADGWRILSPDGVELGMRELVHPHVTEQPFTRSLGGVVLPEALTHVLVEARCSVDGWSGVPVRVALPTR